ncbi:MAG: RDD family protein [Propionivibrio sp.]
MSYEAILLVAVLLLGLVLPHAILGAFALRAASAPVLWSHLFALLLAYFAWFWTHGGQTLPMKTWRIRLVNLDGAAINPAQAFLRYALSWASLLLFGIGIFWACLDRDRQFLHDRLAGTRLIIAS